MKSEDQDQHLQKELDTFLIVLTKLLENLGGLGYFGSALFSFCFKLN